MKHIFSSCLSAVGIPRCLAIWGIGTPRWQLNETLILANAICYHYVNPGGVCATQRKSGIRQPTANGGKNRPSCKPRFLIGAERPGRQRHGHRQALGIGRASVYRLCRRYECRPRSKTTLSLLLLAWRRPIFFRQ
jgi:hypothetical protein